MTICKLHCYILILSGLLASGFELRSGELLQTEKIIPAEVPAWTQARVTGSIPANWKVATVRNSEFTCSSATENGSPVFLCELKKGLAYFIIPAPEIRTAQPIEFFITMERPPEWNNETILSVKGGKEEPSVWGGGFLEGIRLEYAPGVRTWKATVNAPDWRGDSRYWLLLELSDPGIYKIYSVGTRALPGNKPYYAIRPAEEKTVNLIRNSRFPLGLPCGWSTGTVHRNSLRVSKERGPSGERFLILETDVPETPLNSEAFNPADFGKINYVSFSYRAKGKWHARVFTGEGSSYRMKNVDLPPSGEWKRIMLAYRPCGNARGHVLQIRGHGRFELDAVRANDTPDPAYRAQNQAEVALAVPENADAAYSRILFDDEPAKVRYLLTGETEGVRIRFRAVNLYGETFELGSAAAASGMIDFSPALKQRPFGQFRIEAVAEKEDRAISPVNELVVTRIARPLFWNRDAPESFFGAIVRLDRSLLSMKAAGVNHVRFHDHGGLPLVGWLWTEPEPGKWNFSDPEIARYRSLKLWILGEFATTPLWASREAKNKKLSLDYRSKWLLPADLHQFETYVSKVVSHYRESIRDWGVGNEPWGGFFYDHYKNGSFVRGDQNRNFAAYQKSAFHAAKRSDPDITVAGINATIRNGKWASELYRRGAGSNCDAVEQHLYSSTWNGFPGDTVERGTRAALGGVKWNKPLWNTEGHGCTSGNLGYPAEPQLGLHLHSIPWINRFDFIADADRQMRYLISNLACGMKRIYLYSGNSGKYVGIMKPAAFCALEQTDGFPSPQLAAHSALARRIDGRTFREVFEPAPGVWCYLFESESGTTAVIIPRRSARDMELSCGLQGASASDLFGNPLSLPMRSGDTLRYMEAPVPAKMLKKSLSMQRAPDDVHPESGRKSDNPICPGRL